MFIIEAEGKTIVHTGDFRTHGRLVRNTSTDYEVQSIPWFEIENPDIFDDEEDW